MYVFVCERSYLRNYTSDLHKIFARSSSGVVVIVLRFVDDVIFSRKPRLLDVAAQLKRSAHTALGLAINCAQ